MYCLGGKGVQPRQIWRLSSVRCARCEGGSPPVWSTALLRHSKPVRTPEWWIPSVAPALAAVVEVVVFVPQFFRGGPRTSSSQKHLPQSFHHRHPSPSCCWRGLKPGRGGK